MADYTKQIFDMLGVEPWENFKIKSKCSGLIEDDFCFDSYLQLIQGEDSEAPECYLLEILNGTKEIIKIPHPTAEEQIAIDYARACGCKWIAQDENGDNFAYIGKPEKYSANSWRNPKDINDWMIIKIPISFLSWEDEEPFYIGQDETEEKEVCKYYSDGECMGQKYHPSVECKGDKSCCERDN